ncbi:response regulator transcription factor [Brevundimonas sp. NPDC092305]|uniref:response regulator transcription factor n=1 Tax=Brevundimonas sp. NPDC092305 TaxID=3363957 RepID=UPI0037FE7BCD
MFDTFQTKTCSPAVKASGRDVGEVAGTTLFIGAGAGDRRLEAVVRTAGFDVRRAVSLAEADLNPDRDDIDLIIMETLPGGHVDFTACHQLAALRMAPILVMAERDDETDRILALELGADDWASPVCGERELLAKVRALTRRRARVSRTAPNPNTVRFANWQLDRITRELRREDGVRTVLSTAEFDLLNLFMRNLGRVLTRDEILSSSSHNRARNERSVLVSVFRLRRKLGSDGAGFDIIRTVRSVGYIMDTPVTEG